MTKLDDIEKAIAQISVDMAQLSVEDLAKLRDWLDKFDGRIVDERSGQDAKSRCDRAPWPRAGMPEGP